jgi:hypothetical protein
MDMGGLLYCLPKGVDLCFERVNAAPDLHNFPADRDCEYDKDQGQNRIDLP